MKKVVKSKNLTAFRIWLELLGYKIKDLEDGFTASGRGTPKSLAYALVLNNGTGNATAFQLGQEFEIHLKAPEQTVTAEVFKGIVAMVHGELVEFAA